MICHYTLICLKIIKQITEFDLHTSDLCLVWVFCSTSEFTFNFFPLTSVLGALRCVWDLGKEQRHFQGWHPVYSQRQQVKMQCSSFFCWAHSHKHSHTFTCSVPHPSQARLHLWPVWACWQQKRRRNPKNGHCATKAHRQLSVQGETEASGQVPSRFS